MRLSTTQEPTKLSTIHSSEDDIQLQRVIFLAETLKSTLHHKMQFHLLRNDTMSGKNAG